MYDQSIGPRYRTYQHNIEEDLASPGPSEKVIYSVESRPPALVSEAMRSRDLLSPVYNFHELLMRTYGFSQVPVSISSSGVFHSNQDDDILETRKQSRVSSVVKRRGKYKSELRTSAIYDAQRLLCTLGPNRSQISNNVPLSFSKDHVLRFGYLLKQGSWRRNWKSVSSISVCPVALTDMYASDFSCYDRIIRAYVTTNRKVSCIYSVTFESQKIQSCYNDRLLSLESIRFKCVENRKIYIYRQNPRRAWIIG